MKYAPRCAYFSTMMTEVICSRKVSDDSQQTVMIEVLTFTKVHRVISQKIELCNIFLPVYSLMLVCLFLFCNIMCSISCRGYVPSVEMRG
jgi:hypothetical protein